MTVRAKIIHEIVTKIDELSDDQLEKILSFVQGIEDLSQNQKSILSFAGSWKDLDPELFAELTEQLHERRLAESDAPGQ